MKIKLPDEAKKRLAEIFTAEYLPAIEKACERYHRAVEDELKKPSIPEDGRTLLLLAEKAAELKDLLSSSKSAIRRMVPHLAGGSMRIHNLSKDLGAVAVACECTPATENTRPMRGRPKGACDIPERMLAYHLFEIYRQAHGGAPGRKIEPGSSQEIGPLPTAARILAPILGLGSDLSRHFRAIEKDHRKLMDKK